MPAPIPAVPHWRRRKTLELCAAFFLLGGVSASAVPYRPTDDAAVLAVVPRSAVTKQSDFQNLYRKLSEDPTNLAAAISVARIQIEDGRANADLRSFGQAQAALATWWADKGAPVEVRLLKAIILLNLDDFRAAEPELDSVLAKDPQNAEARLARAYLRQATGALAASRSDCEALPASIAATAAAICFARIEAATGAASQALDRLLHALDTDQKVTPATRGVAQGVAADAALALGRDEEASRLFTAASGESARIPTLVAYADFLLDNGRPAEVLGLLADRSEADSVVLRLAIAGRAVGDPRTQRWIDLLAERFAADRANNVQTEKRERARFELEIKDNPVAALGLARANWKEHKEVADARLLLQAAVAAGDPDSASGVLAFVKANGLTDMRLKPLQDKIAEGK